MSGNNIFAVITVSDTCTKDITLDRSGPQLVKLITKHFTNTHVYNCIVPDECDAIQRTLLNFIDQQVAVIITTGGTGFGPRDVTPEATRAVVTKDCPQFALVIALASLQMTKFAALSRGVCGIARQSLILNFPGSEKAVTECFEAVRELLPHAIQLISNDLPSIRTAHEVVQSQKTLELEPTIITTHICQHKTGSGKGNNRNSPFAAIPVTEALSFIFSTVNSKPELSLLLTDFIAPLNIPPFRASIKDGYAMKASGFSGTKKVLGCITAGEGINNHEILEDECFKINTGAPVPLHADSVVQVEDTKLLQTKKNGEEDLVEILVDPMKNLDIRPIGCDLRQGTKLFPSLDHSDVVIKSILASVGQLKPAAFCKLKIAIISTGSELLAPGNTNLIGKIYDSNTTMIEELLKYFGFSSMRKLLLNDDLDTVQRSIADLFETVDFIICSGGVSMGDKDYIKPVLEKLSFKIHFGRVNMKPGKPMTFASHNKKYFFGLPGNPVSAFVTFHLFALPAIRWAVGWAREKCELPIIQVTLKNNDIALDLRPEYMRASITSSNGQLFASINGNQMSSRLQSVLGADVLLHCPGRSSNKTSLNTGDRLSASVLRYDFITKYE